MAELFVVGGLMFWIAMLAWIVVVWAFTENEHGFCGLISTVVYGCVLQFVFKVDVLHWLLSHPIPLIGFGVFYFFLGALWSFWRWYLFAKDSLEPYIRMKTDWLISKGESTFDSIPEHLKEEWVKYIEGDYGERRRLCQTPLVRDNKAKIMRWIGYWPLNAISWAFNDMIRRFVKMIYNYIHDWLQSIANRVFSVVKKDLPTDFKYTR